MRTISQQELNRQAISGSKVKKISAKPAVETNIYDARPDLSVLQGRIDVLKSELTLIKQETSGDVGQYGKTIEHLVAQIHDLSNQVKEIQRPKPVQISRGKHGYIDSVSVGGKTFRFNRNHGGANAGRVETIDVISRQ